MKQKNFAIWLKIIIICVALAGLLIDFLIIPSIGREMAGDDPALTRMFWPWLIFAWAFSIPCYAALVLAWRTVSNIGRDRSFCVENAKYIKYISILAGADTAFLFTVNTVFLFINMNHPGVFIFMLFVAFVGVAITVGAAALSHLTAKAADIQTENELTI